MLPYFKKYSIIACVIGVVPSLIITAIYPFLTGTIMAASIGGLLLLLAIFIVSMIVGVNVMERKAESDTAAMLSLYNNDCDPQALIDRGRAVAAAITFPCREAAAWFMSYYAQAMLDAGDKDGALQIERGIRESVQAAKNPQAKAGILVNLIPLSDKTEGTQAALELIREGLQLTRDDTTPAGSERRAFLESQEKIMNVRTSGDSAAAVQLDEGILSSNAYPMRIRVEAAWAQARAYFKLGDANGERKALDFVAANGNKLALVTQAKQRLASLS